MTDIFDKESKEYYHKHTTLVYDDLKNGMHITFTDWEEVHHRTFVR